jgi:hypothetical protein
MARKVGRIIGRGRRTWRIRVYNRRNSETKKRRYLNQPSTGLRDAQPHLNKMLSEQDRGRNLDSSKQTLINSWVVNWNFVQSHGFRANSMKDYEGLARPHMRPQLGSKTLAGISALDIRMLYQDLLDRNLLCRSIRSTTQSRARP